MTSTSVHSSLPHPHTLPPLALVYLPVYFDRRLLANLKYVVVDEGHAYKGVFGCHAALVLRRLRRLCDRVYHSQVGGV